MAKKEPVDNDDVTFLGQSVDPELQAKVEEYMEAEETPVKPKAPISVPIKEPDLTGETIGAPLLPTDQLPDIAKEKPAEAPKVTLPKKKIIPITHHDDEEVEAEAKTAEEPAVESPEPEETEPAEPPAEDIPEVEKPEPEEPTEPEEEPEIIPDEPASELEPLPEEEPATEEDELGLEDVQTSHAVDEIIATEADDLLAAEDAKRGVIKSDDKPKKEKKSHKNPFKFLLAGKRSRKAVFAAALIVLVVACTIPNSRYLMLNIVGVRASTSMKILDDKTQQPLKNVEVSLSGKSSKTDVEGYVKLEKVKLGTQNMTIKKPAFAEVSRKVTIGWGSNPLAEVQLTPVGSQYSFVLTDFLSGKPIAKAEAINGEASARSDEKGEAVLTVPEVDADELEIQIVTENYRTETVKVPTTKKEVQNISLVPSRKHAFVSKRSGKFDVYKIDVDGKNEEKVLAGTGVEREDTIALVSHPKKDTVAFLSTRESVRNQDGFLLSTLTLIDLSNNEKKNIAQSERVQIIDWIGDKLVYVKIAQGESEASPQRHRLLSYDISSNSEKELASTNYFNDVLVAKGAVYYSPAVYKVNGSVGLYKINPDGTSKKTLYQKEVWNLFRTTYEKISVSVGQDWYELDLNNDGLTKSSGAPPQLRSRIYVDSPEAKRSLWTDERDGKGVILSYDPGSKEEKPLQTQSGIKNPIRWLDEDHAVYRVANGQETADYVLSLSGGDPKKIKDVTNSAGIDRWYYY